MKIRDGQDEAMVSTLQDACSTQSTCRDANEMKLEGTRRQGQARAGQGRHDGQRSGLLIGTGGGGERNAKDIWVAASRKAWRVLR